MTDDEVKQLIQQWKTNPDYRMKEYTDVFGYMMMCHCSRCTGLKPYIYLAKSLWQELMFRIGLATP